MSGNGLDDLRPDPVNAFTMAGIVRDAGLSIDEFKRLSGLRYNPTF